MKQKEEFKLEGDKYRFYIENHILKCDRYEEKWRDFSGDKAVHSLFCRILEQEKIIDNLRDMIRKQIWNRLDKISYT